MKSAFSYALMAWLAVSAPAGANTTGLLNSTKQFCQSIREANALGMSGNPASDLGRSIAEKTNASTTFTYATLWRIAKNMDIYECDSMW